jgi:hypothetical protein
LEGFAYIVEEMEREYESAVDDGLMEAANARNEANASLIAAAPDLLAALRAVHDWQYGDGNEDDALDLMAGAIAKATGEDDDAAVQG